VRLTSPVVASQPACVNDAALELEIAYSSHGREESSKEGALIDAFYAERLDGEPTSSTTLDKLLGRFKIDINVLPQRPLCERRPVATDEGGVEVEASSRSLFSVVVPVDWMGDSEDVPDGLERQVVDGGHGRGGGVEVDGRCWRRL
jgi:hypothetical protein